MNNLKFSIIGSESYIAKHIINILNKMGHTLFLYDNLKICSSYPKSVTHIDITNFNTLSNINTDVNYILIFSGITGTHQGFTDYHSFINVNVIGLLNILTLIKKLKCRIRVIFPSTRLIYKGSENKLTEKDPKEFKTIYALTKFNCETILKMYQEIFGIPYTIFRICLPYGNLLNNNMSYGTLGCFIAKASKGEDITIFGDGNQKRSLIHIEDLANIFIYALINEKSKNNIYNIGGNDVYSISEIAHYIAELFHVNVKYKKWPKLAKEIETGHTVFDSSKIELLTNYKYQNTFKNWIIKQKLDFNK